MQSVIQKSTPIRQLSVPVNEPLLNGNERAYLNECISSGWISSDGPFVKEFETKFAHYIGRKHAIAVANGSVALDAAVAALEFPSGSEIILPSFTIISCAAAIVRAGCKPVLVDSNLATWNMNVEEIKQKITSRTKAIMAVHIYGLPVDMNPLLELANQFGLLVIEDAAELIGQTYFGKQCGSFGNISTVSFYANKHITTGEGGMILTDDDYLAERCRSLRNLCFQKERRYVHDELGFNFRMTNLQAAVGLAQLERLETFIEKKRAIGRYYTAALQDLANIQLPLAQTPYAENIYWVYGILLKQATHNNTNADTLRSKLQTAGIGTRAFFVGMHDQPVFKKMGLFNGESYPIAHQLAQQGFYIPSGLAITSQQMDYVIHALQELLT